MRVRGERSRVRGQAERGEVAGVGAQGVRVREEGEG